MKRPTRVPRASPEPGAPCGQPRAAPGSDPTMKGPSQRLDTETSLPQHPTVSGRHGDPKVPSSGRTENRSTAPHACAKPRPGSRMRGLSFSVTTSTFAARTTFGTIPGPASFPPPGHSDANSWSVSLCGPVQLRLLAVFLKRIGNAELSRFHNYGKPMT